MKIYSCVFIFLMVTKIYSNPSSFHKQPALRDTIALQSLVGIASFITLSNFLISKCLLEHWRKEDSNILLDYIACNYIKGESLEHIYEFYKNSPKLNRNSFKQLLARILAHPTTLLAIESFFIALLHLMLSPQQPIRSRYVAADIVTSTAMALGFYKLFDLTYNFYSQEKNKIKESIFVRVATY